MGKVVLDKAENETPNGIALVLGVVSAIARGCWRHRRLFLVI